MEWLFGRDPTLEDKFVEFRNICGTHTRLLEKTSLNSQYAQRQIMADLKKAGNGNRIADVCTHAKRLLRERADCRRRTVEIERLNKMVVFYSNLKTNAAMEKSMRELTRSMVQMNKTMEGGKMLELMMRFQEEARTTKENQTVIAEAMDEVCEGSDEEEIDAESKELVAAILDEAGLDSVALLSRIEPGNDKSLARKVDADAELQEKYEALLERL